MTALRSTTVPGAAVRPTYFPRVSSPGPQTGILQELLPESTACLYGVSNAERLEGQAVVGALQRTQLPCSEPPACPPLLERPAAEGA